MTIGCRDIETILGPLRSEHPRSAVPISECSEVVFTNSWDEPLRDQLGNPEIEEDRDAALACMGIVPMIGFLDSVPCLASGPAWNLINHQTAGYACGKARFLGHFVRLKSSIHEACLTIARDLHGSLLRERDDPSLDESNDYRRQLQAIGLNCNRSETIRHLQEGLYPAEIDQATADMILEDKVVLADFLLEPRNTLNLSYMSFFFIAANCD